MSSLSTERAGKCEGERREERTRPREQGGCGRFTGRCGCNFTRHELNMLAASSVDFSLLHNCGGENVVS